MKAGPDAPGPDDLWTISAAGFSATVDAFARDPESHGLWFLSMVGSQTALKAIWAALLKQPPESAHLIRREPTAPPYRAATGAACHTAARPSGRGPRR